MGCVAVADHLADAAYCPDSLDGLHHWARPNVALGDPEPICLACFEAPAPDAEGIDRK